MKPPLPRHALALAALVALTPITLPAAAQTRTTVDWTDWETLAPDLVTGSVRVSPNETVGVTFAGQVYTAVLGALPEPYWFPSSTYTGAKLANPPPNRDLIVLAGGPGTGAMKLSFSQALTDPVLAITSLGLTNSTRSINIQTAMFFDQPFEVLSTGPGYAANGQYTPFFVMPEDPKSLYGTESSGVIRFRGSFTELTWTSPLREENEFGNLVGTYMFTLGSAGCNEYELSPPTGDTQVRAGCTAYTRDAEFTQQHRLDVRGSLRAESRYVTAGTLAVAPGGNADLRLGGHVAPAGRISVSGRLDNRALLNVAGRVETFAGSVWNSSGLTVEPLGEVSVAGQAVFVGPTSINGLLQVKDSGNLTTFSPLLVGGSGARLELQGANAQFNALAGLQANSNAQIAIGGRLTVLGTLDLSGAQIEVLPSGQFVSNASGSVLATTVNAGAMSFQSGTIDFTAGSFVNSGSFAVNGGLVALRGGMVFSNAGPGRIEVAGSGGLRLAGASVMNLGQIVVGEGGTLEIFGSALQNQGSLQTAAGSLLLASGSVVTSGSATLAGDFVNQATFTNQGTLAIAPGRMGTTSVNNGLLVNEATMRIGAPVLDVAFANLGTLRNQAQLTIEPGAVLENQGSLFNNGTLTVDGRLAIEGGALVQSPTGHLAVNGILGTAGGLNLQGGSIGGSGVIDGALVLAAGASALPGNSPGTLTVLGDLTLEPGARLELEVSRSGAHDLLRAGSFTALSGSTVALRFLDGPAPDLDRTFDVIEVTRLGGGAGFGAASVEGLPAGMQLDTYLRAAGLGDKLGVAFTPDHAQRVYSAHFASFGDVWVADDELWLADSALGSFGGTLTVEGTFGLRRDAAFGAGTVSVGSSGRLLSSSEDLVVGRSIGVQGELATRGNTRAGALEVASGGRWHNSGSFVLGHEDEANTRLVNRGLVQHAGGTWHNEGTGGTAPLIHNAAGARMEVAAPMSGAASVLNEGGFLVARGARVQDLDSFVQAAGLLHVDGALAATALRVSRGVVSGSGSIEGPVTLRAEETYADPGAIVLRPGAESGSEAGGVLTFTDRLEIGMGTALEFVVAGEGAAGRLALQGGAIFDPASAIRIVLIDGYMPLAETSWRVIDLGPGATLDGFDSVATINTAVFLRRPGIEDEFWSGGYRSLVQGADGVDLTLVPVPVPEPGSWALMLTGAGVLVLVTRRRRLR
jgi:hypothetical protein